METLQDTEVPSEIAEAAEIAQVEEARKLTRPRGEKLCRRHREAKLKAERVQEKLLSLPGWRLSADGNSLVRVRTFRNNTSAMAFTFFANTVMEGSGHRVHLTLSGPRVLLTLQSRAYHGGLTESLFDLAQDLG